MITIGVFDAFSPTDVLLVSISVLLRGTSCPFIPFFHSFIRKDDASVCFFPFLSFCIYIATVGRLISSPLIIMYLSVNRITFMQSARYCLRYERLLEISP